MPCFTVCRFGPFGRFQIADVIDQMLPQIISNMEDDFEQTRLVCSCVLEALLRLYPEGFQGGFENYNRLHTLYPELLKRLDDNSDAVRQVAIKVRLPTTALAG